MRIKTGITALAALLAALTLCVTAYAADSYVHGYYRYTVEDGSVTITAYIGKEAEVIVPAMIGGSPVNTIAAGAFAGNGDVKTVSLPDTVTTVEEGAFASGQTVTFDTGGESAPDGESAPSGSSVPGDGGSVEEAEVGLDPTAPASGGGSTGGSETAAPSSGGGSTGSGGSGSAAATDPGGTGSAVDVSDRFTDVSKTAWYHDAVQWAVDKGLMNGVSDTLFAPNDTCTRAMVVTMLWRLAGEPVVNYALPYTDVSGDMWYAEAVRWAASTGAVNGTSETTFSPNAPVTREQLAAILYRYAQAQGKGFTGSWMFLLDYPDAGQVSEYADEAMHWMTMHGVITGMGDGTLAPQDNATRAQIATMFMRFCAEMEE